MVLVMLQLSCDYEGLAVSFCFCSSVIFTLNVCNLCMKVRSSLVPRSEFPPQLRDKIWEWPGNEAR